MGMGCTKDEWKGRCCCTCVNQRVIVKHPWNDGAGKGRITESMGYGCASPEFTVGFEGRPTVIFFDSGHDLCEMHEFVTANAKVTGAPHHETNKD